MISRFDFIKDIISSDNPTYDYSRHYNEISVLYGLVGGRSDIDIFTTKYRGKFAFSLLMEKDESALAFKHKYNGSKFTVCDGTYRIKAKLPKSNTVAIYMYKEKEA